MSTSDSHRNFLKKQVEMAEWRTKFYNQILHQLKTEAHFVDYFSKYNPSSAELFMEHYANAKVDWYEHGMSYAKHVHQRKEQFYTESIEVLKIIQRKKLFNLVCQWGLGEVKLAGIEVSEELIQWQSRIFDCPFLQPITQQDIEDYITFLYDGDPDEKRSMTDVHGLYSIYFEGCQCEDDWMEDERYPAYFLWHDQHYNTLRFLEQPITRIVKEWKYYRIQQADQNKRNSVDYSYKPTKPYASFYELKNELIARFEDAGFRELHRAYERWTMQNEFNECIELDLIELESYKGWVPIEDNDDWRVAISRANEQHKRVLLAQELGYVFDEYLEMKETESDFAEWYDSSNEQHSLFTVEEYKNKILEGRVLAGEPADFNF